MNRTVFRYWYYKVFYTEQRYNRLSWSVVVWRVRLTNNTDVLGDEDSLTKDILFSCFERVICTLFTECSDHKPFISASEMNVCSINKPN